MVQAYLSLSSVWRVLGDDLGEAARGVVEVPSDDSGLALSEEL
jgi:hypothetical protein